MAGPPDSAYAEITIEFHGDAVPLGAATSFGIELGLTEPGDALVAIEALLDPLVGGVCTGEVGVSKVVLKRGPEETGPTFELASTIEGGLGGSAAPPNVSLLVKKPAVGVSGRFSGRMFWPAVPEGSISPAGILSPSYHFDANTLFGEFHEALVADVGVIPVIFSATDESPRLSDTYVVQPVVATQRRRLRR